MIFVIHSYRLEFDGNTTFLFEFHGVEYLFFVFVEALIESFCYVEKAVG